MTGSAYFIKGKVAASQFIDSFLTVVCLAFSNYAHTSGPASLSKKRKNGVRSEKKLIFNLCLQVI